MNGAANHICRNCGFEYYACPDCDKRSTWKSVACSFECYQKYVDDVLESRSHKSEETSNHSDESNKKSEKESIAAKHLKEKVQTNKL